MDTKPRASVDPSSQLFSLLMAAIAGGLLGALLSQIGGPALVGVIAAAIYIKVRSRIRLGVWLGSLTDLGVLALCALVTVLGGSYQIGLLGSWSIPDPL